MPGSTGCATVLRSGKSSIFRFRSGELARPYVELLETAAFGEQPLELGHELRVKRDRSQERVVGLRRHDRANLGAQPREFAALELQHVLFRQAAAVDRLKSFAHLLHASGEFAPSRLRGTERRQLR